MVQEIFNGILEMIVNLSIIIIPCLIFDFVLFVLYNTKRMNKNLKTYDYIKYHKLLSRKFMIFE